MTKTDKLSGLMHKIIEDTWKAYVPVLIKDWLAENLDRITGAVVQRIQEQHVVAARCPLCGKLR